MDPSWQSLQLCMDFTDLWMVLIIYYKCMHVMDRVVDEQKNTLWGFRWCGMFLHVYEQIGFLRFLCISMHIYIYTSCWCGAFWPNCLLCMNYGFLKCEYWDALIHMKVIIVEVCCIMYLSCLCVMMLLSFDKQFLFLGEEDWRSYNLGDVMRTNWSVDKFLILDHFRFFVEFFM